MDHKLEYWTAGFGALGLLWYSLGLSGWLRPLPVALSLLLLLVILPWPRLTWPHLSRSDAVLGLILAAQVALNAILLRLPDTSFDSVWYHLPEAQVYAATGKIAKIPELMYSTMPRLGEVLFVPGFWAFNNARLVSFFIYFWFLIVVYRLGRRFLSRPLSLCLLIAVNSLLIVSWQSSAGYVDMLRSVFEVAAVLCLLPPVNVVLAGVLTGFALSVKMQAIIGLLAGSILLFWHTRSWKKVLLYLGITIGVAFPWYLDNFYQSGHFLYPTNLPEIKTNVFTEVGVKSWSEWIIKQLTTLPFLPVKLSLNPASQLSPIILILFPFLFKKSKLIFPYLIPFLLFWWFWPPKDTRYAFTGIVLLLLLELWSVSQRRSTRLKLSVIGVMLITVGLNFGIRFYATARYWQAILGSQSATTYIESQTTPFNRDKMELYYSGFWKNYHYPNH